MDCDFSKVLDKNIIFYGVYNTETEILDESDCLCAVRRNFFESGKKLKNRSTLKTETDILRYSYTIENGRVLKWKKLLGSQQVERVIEDSEGYFVESMDLSKRPIKRAYYNNLHIWRKSEFYSPDDKINPVYVLAPSFENDSIAIIRTSEKGISDTFHPFNIPLDKTLTEKLNIISGEPKIFCKTNQGDFYFCTKAEIDSRKEALDKIINRDNDYNINSADKNSEKDSSAFIINIEKLNKDNTDFDLAKSNEILISSMEQKDNLSMPNESENINAAKAVSEHKAEQEIHQYIDPHSENDIDEKNPDTVSETANEENINTEFGAFVYERGEIPQSRETACVFASVCPYETIEKQIIESGKKQYFYFGELSGDKRSGRGRTAMKSGETAYEGDYLEDKRDGFGVYYYKSGKLCYAGNWKNNKRNGLGAAFSPLDGSAYIGEWDNDTSVGLGASFDRKGKLLYLGILENGKKNGAGVTFEEDNNTFFVGKYKNGEFLGTGTQFDKNGVLLYIGEYKNNMRCGIGTSYNADGTVKYSGRWFNNVYDGEGTLCFENGRKLSGNFKNGRAFGKATLTDQSGEVIYTGAFADDVYNGTGRLFFDGGAYIEGRFVDGDPTGVFSEYNSDGEMVYCGEWNNMKRSGCGIEYKNGQKIYDGGFENSEYSGDGKLFDEGRLIYAGKFLDGKRNGFGVEFKDDKIVYQGMWKNNVYDGCGILYENGNARFAGMFAHGKKNSRINEISNNNVVRKSLYKDDELIYMCEYSDDDSLLYYGNVKDNKRNGMGCSFITYCEKQFEGIFKNDEPEKAMKVFFKELSELPECKELENTEYELYRKTPEYIIEKNVSGGIFTGRLKNGKPDGKGTILYSDHRYTGMFSDGKPSGDGMIYMRDGREIRGYFSLEPFSGCETVAMSDITYYKR